jgi:hypothetical protein
MYDHCPLVLAAACQRCVPTWAPRLFGGMTVELIFCSTVRCSAARPGLMSRQSPPVTCVALK